MRALEARLDVEVAETQRRGHAAELAAEAVAAGYDGVMVMAGDGTANEVLNGIGVELPVGFLPAGGTSVLPRALGMPRHIGPAAARLADALVVGASASSTSASSTAAASPSPRASERTPRPCGSSTTRGGRGAGARATPTSRPRSCARCCAATSASRRSR